MFLKKPRLKFPKSLPKPGLGAFSFFPESLRTPQNTATPLVCSLHGHFSHSFLRFLSTSQKMPLKSSNGPEKEKTQSPFGFQEPDQEESLVSIGLSESLPKVCSGCGTSLQYLFEEKDGYIDYFALKRFGDSKIPAPKENLEILTKFEVQKARTARLKKSMESIGTKGKNKEEFLNEDLEEEDLLTEEDLKKALNQTKGVFCKRCSEIKSHKSKEIFQEHFQTFQKTHLRALAALKMAIKPNSVVLYVLDVTDFMGSIHGELYQSAIHKGCQVYFAVNKCDAIQGVSQVRLKKWLIDQIHSAFSQSIEPQDIFLTSCRTGLNCEELLKALKKSAPKPEGDNNQNAPKPQVFIIGAANSGKTSLINQFIQISKKHKKNTVYHDPFNPQFNYNPNETKEKKGSDEKQEDTHQPTVSLLPGTTPRVHRISSLSLGVRFYDTPGVGSEGSVQLAVEEFESLKALVVSSKIKGLKVNLSKEHGCLYIGGLARLDLLSRGNCDVTVFCSNQVSVHVTSREQANDFYLRHFGILLKPTYSKDIKEVSFKKNIVKIKRTKEDKNAKFYELEIKGLGVIFFEAREGQQELQFELYLPEGIAWKANRVGFWNERDTEKIEVGRYRRVKG